MGQDSDKIQGQSAENHKLKAPQPLTMPREIQEERLCLSDEIEEILNENVASRVNTKGESSYQTLFHDWCFHTPFEQKAYVVVETVEAGQRKLPRNVPLLHTVVSFGMITNN